MRDEILSTDQNTIRSLAPYLEGVNEAGTICVIGAKGKVEKDKELFTKIENLL